MISYGWPPSLYLDTCSDRGSLSCYLRQFWVLGSPLYQVDIGLHCFESQRTLIPSADLWRELWHSLLHTIPSFLDDFSIHLLIFCLSDLWLWLFPHKRNTHRFSLSVHYVQDQLCWHKSPWLQISFNVHGEKTLDNNKKNIRKKLAGMGGISPVSLNHTFFVKSLFLNCQHGDHI